MPCCPPIVETVAETLKLPYAAITFSTEAHVQSSDQNAEIVASYGTRPAYALTRLPLLYQQEQIGELLLAPRAPGETFDPADLRLLADLARQAGIAAHAVRLTAELAARPRAAGRRARGRAPPPAPRPARWTGAAAGQPGAHLTAARKLLRRDLAIADEMLGDAIVHAQGAITDASAAWSTTCDRPRWMTSGWWSRCASRLPSMQRERPGASSVDAPRSTPPLPAAVEVACYRIVRRR